MYQIDVPSAVVAMPAPAALGTPGYFTDGSVAGGVPPTVVTADWLNAVMVELVNVVTAGGVAPSKVATNQLLLAIQNMIEARSGNYALDTGTAGAYAVLLNPPLAAYSNGLQVRFRAASPNPGASTLNAGAGALPLLREDGVQLQQGDIPNNSIVSATYDKPANAFLLNAVVPSQFGAVAKLNLGTFLKGDGAGNLTLKTGAFLGDDGSGSLAVLSGAGLESDGVGNLRIKLADNSLRRTASGIQSATGISRPGGATSVTAVSNGTLYVPTATVVLTVDRSTNLFNGFGFSVDARNGAVTVTPNAADSINGNAAGISYTVLQATSAEFVCDGAGNLEVLYQSAPPGSLVYVNAAATLGAGQYEIDTSVAAVPLVFSAGIAGSVIRLIDFAGTWRTNQVTLTPGSGTIMGTTSYTLNMGGADILFRWNAATNDWRLI